MYTFRILLTLRTLWLAQHTSKLSTLPYLGISILCGCKAELIKPLAIAYFALHYLPVVLPCFTYTTITNLETRLIYIPMFTQTVIERIVFATSLEQSTFGLQGRQLWWRDTTWSWQGTEISFYPVLRTMPPPIPRHHVRSWHVSIGGLSILISFSTNPSRTSDAVHVASLLHIPHSFPSLGLQNPEVCSHISSFNLTWHGAFEHLKLGVQGGRG